MRVEPRVAGRGRGEAIAGKALHDFLGVGFRENHHLTSFSIGIDAPDIIRKKVLETAQYPVLKLKVGDARDKENFSTHCTFRGAGKTFVRVDANEGWRNQGKRPCKCLTGW